MTHLFSAKDISSSSMLCLLISNRQKITHFLVCLSVLILSLTSIHQSHAEVPTKSTDSPDWIYTARPGDSIHSIAKTYLKSPGQWTRLLRYNNLNNANPLPPGTIIKIPLYLLKSYPKPATLIETSGQVWYRKAHTSAYVPAIKGLKLNIGDELKTVDGQAWVTFADGSRLKIARQSIIIFNKLTHYGKTGMVDVRFRLNKGGIRTKVTPRKGPAARYEVTTPSAVAAVRGTTFRIRVIDAYTITEVTEGKVQVNNAHSKLLLREGQGASIGTTGNLAPVKLLPPPKISPLPDTVNQLPLNITWQAVSGANAYRVEVFRNDPDTLPLFSQRFSETILSLNELVNGKYWVNVWAVDPSGIEGLFSSIHFVVSQQAAPAILLSPLTNTTIDNQIPEFKWKLTNQSMLSRLEISTDPNFESLYYHTAFGREEQAELGRALIGGQYYWRVVTLAGSDSMAYTTPRPMTVNDHLATTRVVAVKYFQDQAKIFWKSVDHADKYLVQLAEDEDFQSMIREDTQEDNSALIRLTAGKNYWVRVKGIGNRYFSSSFDQPQLLRIRSSN